MHPTAFTDSATSGRSLRCITSSTGALTRNWPRRSNTFARPPFAFQTTRTSMFWCEKDSSTSGEIPLSVISRSIRLAGQIIAGLQWPALLESATTTTCFAWRTMARTTAASSGSIIEAPCTASTPQTPINTRCIENALNDSTAVGPTREKAPGHRSDPPVRIVYSMALELNSMLMFTALLTSVRRLRCFSRCAICAVVVPALNPMVSPSPIKSAAAAAMRRFSFANLSSRVSKEASKRNGSYTAWSASIAPPWVLCTSPRVSRRTKSRRTLAGEVPTVVVNSSTEVLPWLCRSRRIWFARSSVFDDMAKRRVRLRFLNVGLHHCTQLPAPWALLQSVQSVSKSANVLLQQLVTDKLRIPGCAHAHAVFLKGDRTHRSLSERCVKFLHTGGAAYLHHGMRVNSTARHNPYLVIGELHHLRNLLRPHQRSLLAS